MQYPEKRHLHKTNYFVDEVGQFRILYRIFHEQLEIRFYHVFDHKNYEKWYQQNTIWVLFDLHHASNG